jgi:hypothetical protein
MSHFERLWLVRAIVEVEVYFDPVEDRRPHTPNDYGSKLRMPLVCSYATIESGSEK